MAVELQVRPRSTAPADASPSISAAQLASAIGTDETTAAQLLAVTWDRCRQYAPGAPSTTLAEAVIRYAGWLIEAPAGGVRSESIGDISTTYSPAMLSGFRASGAAALLSPWRVRRAGSIG